MNDIFLGIIEHVMSTRKYVSTQKQMSRASQSRIGYQAENRLPEGHICFLIDEIVDELDLGPAARGNSVLGAPSRDPRTMLKVLFYGLGIGDCGLRIDGQLPTANSQLNGRVSRERWIHTLMPRAGTGFQDHRAVSM